MGIKRIAYCIFFSVHALLAHEASIGHIPYLMMKGEVETAIGMYQEHFAKTKRHSPEILQEMALTLIDEGNKSPSAETQLISLYGIGVSKLSNKLPFLEKCMKSDFPNVQLAAIHLLGEFHDDLTEMILTQAMHSPYFPIRMEALYRLCLRKSRFALPHLESLRNLIPDEYSFFFPDLYGMIGSEEAMKKFKKLLTNPHLDVRLATILSTAKFHRDDMLPLIRKIATHKHPAELETTAFTMGALQDLLSVETLKEMTQSKYTEVELSAALALISLGHQEYENIVIKQALAQNPFAIYALRNIHNTNSILANFLKSNHATTQINAAVALLAKRDDSVKEIVERILLQKASTMGYAPAFSLGRAHFAWRAIPSSTKLPKYKNVNMEAMTLQFKEDLLQQCLELKEETFLSLANTLFEKKAHDLIPLLVRLLENHKSDTAIALLKKNAQKLGDPLIRGYCLLSLYRMQHSESIKKKFLSWITESKNHPLIQFRPILERGHETFNERFDLTPETHSRLLLESYEAIAMMRDKTAIQYILDALKTGNPDNRGALAGLLLCALQ